MLDSIQTHGERILRHPGGLAAVALGTMALTADIFFGRRESQARRSSPEFYIARRAKALGTIAVAPGCQTDGKNYLRQIRSHAPKMTVVGADYAKHGFNGEEVCEGLGDNLKQVGAERPSFICQSMAGMVIMRQFMEYADQTGLAEQLGGFGTIVLDSSPFDYDDIRKPYRRLLAAATLSHYSWTADHLKLRIAKHLRKPGANAHLDTIHSEGSYMKSLRDSQPLPAIMDRVVYISSAYDHVINSDQAAEKYEAIAPTGTFTRIVDEARKSPSHTATGKHLDTLVELATTRETTHIAATEPEQADNFADKWANLRVPTSLVS